MKKNISLSWFWKCVIAFLLTYAIFCLKFPHYVTAPNSQTFLHNGDPHVTFFDMIYHVKYDTTSTFSAMNYPVGEYLFMTDANGSFVTVMRWINQYVFEITPYISGIFLTIVFLLIGFCGMLVFMMLKSQGISDTFSFILAPLITLLSPQIVRIACHFSLSFPFVIPFIMVWAIRKYKVPKIEILDILFSIITFFFFMNNAYIGFIMCMFMALIGFFVYIGDRKNKAAINTGVILFSIPLLITLVVYLILKINDPYTDRIEEQWGFFFYNTKLDSLFTPKYSLAASFLEQYKIRDNRSIEWTNNLGIIPILMVLSYFIYNIVRKFRKSFSRLFPKDKMMNAFIWSSLCMYLFAANRTLIPIKDFIEPYLGPILMFKSSGRFSWPLYFVVALFASKILQSWYHKLNLKSKNLGYLLVIPLLILYGYETNFYLDKRYKGKDVKNYFTSKESLHLEQEFKKLGITKNNYQAMYTLPLMIGWNEKISGKVYNSSEQGSLVTSVHTGIPMINGRLSRNSTGYTLGATQISSHPWIKKEILHTLPNDKPILLIQGERTDKHLSPGEIALKNNAKILFKNKRFSISALPLNTVLDYSEIEHAKQLITTNTFDNKPLIRYHFDDETDKDALFGKGCHTFKKGREEIIRIEKTFEQKDTLTFYSWNEVTTKKYGMPEYVVLVKDENGKESKKIIFSKDTKDIYKNWARAEYSFSVPKGKNMIRVVAKTNQDFKVDEMVIKYTRDTILNRYSNFDLLNGYPILKD
ncbi:MAG: hypothetical protein V3V14_04045 [Saprospiraceae bacterium]